MLLELRGVTVYYGDALAVTDINLSQEEGTVVSVIGANGAGKSTILKAIIGLVPLRSGTHRDGRKADRRARHRRDRQIGDRLRAREPESSSPT